MDGEQAETTLTEAAAVASAIEAAKAGAEAAGAAEVAAEAAEAVVEKSEEAAEGAEVAAAAAAGAEAAAVVAATIDQRVLECVERIEARQDRIEGMLTELLHEADEPEPEPEPEPEKTEVVELPAEPETKPADAAPQERRGRRWVDWGR